MYRVCERRELSHFKQCFHQFYPRKRQGGQQNEDKVLRRRCVRNPEERRDMPVGDNHILSQKREQERDQEYRLGQLGKMAVERLVA